MKICLYIALVCPMIVSIPMIACSVEIVGHRGAAHDAPENTLVSVITAWNQGADAAEVDIYLTKDERIVVIHDETTKRTAGVDLKVSETTADVLRRLDVGSFKDKRFAGEKIPFLEEVLETIPPGRKLFIEIKCGSEVLPFLQKTLSASGKMSQIVIIGFGLETVAESKKLMPEIPTFWLKGADKDKETKEYIPHSKDLIRIVKEKNLDGLDVSYQGVDKRFVDAVKASGLELHIYTVDDLDEAKRLKRLGVDGITTDRPGWLLEHL
ncbi:MAG: glycerophosphodiester phosphodiesterase [bacterium]